MEIMYTVGPKSHAAEKLNAMFIRPIHDTLSINVISNVYW
jgi:hypothetical protein